MIILILMPKVFFLRDKVTASLNQKILYLNK
jgi:hypothetical protein